MGHFVWKYHSKCHAKYELIDRAGSFNNFCCQIGLPTVKSALDSKFDKVKNMKLLNGELNFIRSLGVFHDKYIDFLS